MSARTRYASTLHSTIVGICSSRNDHVMTLPYPYGEEVIAEINCPRLLALTCVTKVLAAPAMEDGLIAQGIFRKLVVIVTRPYSRTGHHDKIVSFFPLLHIRVYKGNHVFLNLSNLSVLPELAIRDIQLLKKRKKSHYDLLKQSPTSSKPCRCPCRKPSPSRCVDKLSKQS